MINQIVHLSYLLYQFWPRSLRGVLDTTVCDKVCQWLPTDGLFSPDTPVSSINKADRHDIAEILLKVELTTLNQTYINFENQYIMYKKNNKIPTTVNRRRTDNPIVKRKRHKDKQRSTQYYTEY